MQPRHVKLLNLLIEGKSNGQIAKAMNITYGTAKEYVGQLLKITGTGNRTELAVWWWEHRNDEDTSRIGTV